MRPSFQVTTPAADLSLVTLDQLRAALNVPTGRDTQLEMLRDTVSADIAAACNIREDGTSPPTLRRETVVDTFHRSVEWGTRSRSRLILSRRFVTDTIAVVESGETLVRDTDYLLDPVTGIVDRVNGLLPCSWFFRAFDLTVATIVVTYQCGFAAIPADLAGAAIELARIRWFQSRRDPLVRQETVEGVGSTSYWIGAPDDPSIPESVMGRLSRFMNELVA